MVLFLFIIMLLDVDKERASSFKKDDHIICCAIAFCSLVVLTYNIFMGSGLPAFELSPGDAFDENKGLLFSSEAKSFGYLFIHEVYVTVSGYWIFTFDCYGRGDCY